MQISFKYGITFKWFEFCYFALNDCSVNASYVSTKHIPDVNVVYMQSYFTT